MKSSRVCWRPGPSGFSRNKYTRTHRHKQAHKTKVRQVNFFRVAMSSCTALALAAGLFNGAYPIFLKRPAVLAARVPPLFFQSAKSSCCCLLGACLVLLRLARSGEPFLFPWWAVASAAAWIPAGLCTIAAVPRLGVGPVMLTSAGTGTLASFLAGSLALGERLKVHTLDGGGTFLLAPAYLAGVLLGMAGLF